MVTNTREQFKPIPMANMPQRAKISRNEAGSERIGSGDVGIFTEENF
jgi:hypothetical protein